jgi:hypothetical protein
VNCIHLLLLELEKSRVVNVRGVYRIQLVVCNWILLTTMASDPKIKIEKLVGTTNWTKWKWHMNMHTEQYDM